MKFVTLECLNCHKSYTRHIAQLKKGSSFCTRKCANAYRTIITACQKCSTEFKAYRSELERGGAKFCSRKCYDIDEIIINCLQCNKTVKVFPSQVKLGRGKFCSYSCAGKYNINFKPDIPPDTPQERFFKNIDQKTDINGCWIWKGLKNRASYGRMTINRKAKIAHRYSWELHYGEIAKGLIICHKCDNPPCVNPEHLFIGTYKDNIRDMVVKGRNRDDRGEKHPMSKLTESQVLIIRSRLANEESMHSLAKEFQVSWGAIHNIKQRKSWSHI